jgi:DNA-directed RNA polymerase subunit K/omega
LLVFGSSFPREESPLNIDDAGTFMKVNIAAQRARQLMQGAAPKVQTKSRKAAAIAIQEVEAGVVEAYTPSELPEALRMETFGPNEGESGSGSESENEE